MYGYHGKYYRIDLSRPAIEAVALSSDVVQRYVGGVGLGAWLLLQESTAGADPLAPESALIVSLSPLVGSPVTTSAKFAVVGKSPLTGRFNDSLSSSQFAIEAKRTGADAIVLTGRAPEWSIVTIDDGVLNVIACPDIVGKSARKTQQFVKETLGTGWSTMSIGPAGENQIPFATISHDNRHAGRGGMGAVLGSKRVKAIAVRGTKRVAVARPSELIKVARDLSARSLGPATEKYREMGTVANLLTFNRLAVLPTRNFQESTFDQAEAISGESLATLKDKARESCAACTIGCEHLFPREGGQPVRLEYESLFALGSLCGVGERDAILNAAQLCDEFGMDTISFGGTFAFACECVERGLMAPADDIDFRFGSVDGLLTAIERTANRQGTGRVLALGTRGLAKELGGAAIDYAPQVKGLELPGYDPRGLPATALGFAVGTRGADHNRSSAYEVDFAANEPMTVEQTVRSAIDAEDKAALMDSLILCKFLRGVFDDIYQESAALLTLITGEETTAQHLRSAAAGINLLKRHYNQREGWHSSEDRLPRRFFAPKEEKTAKRLRGTPLTEERLQAMIASYYSQRGLDARGRLPDSYTP